MKGLWLALFVVGFWPMMMAVRQMASAICRRLARMFQGERSLPAVAGPSFVIAFHSPASERDSVARKVAVRRAVERRIRPVSQRPPVARTSWKRAASAQQVAQETGSRSA